LEPEFRLGELQFPVLMILYAIALYILMHESLLLNQILVSFNLLMFVVYGFRESMCVLVVSIVLSRAVKMGWNPQANPAHHEFGSGWVEFFFKFQYRLIFDTAHLKPGSFGLNPW